MDRTFFRLFTILQLQLQFTIHAFDRQTDGRTEFHRYRVCIPCSAVKTTRDTEGTAANNVQAARNTIRKSKSKHPV